MGLDEDLYGNLRRSRGVAEWHANSQPGSSRHYIAPIILESMVRG
jgi:hypothetical protein